MRSNEERVAAVKRRVAELEKLEKRKKLRRGRLIAAAAVAASLAVIIGLSNLMPGMEEEFWQGGFHNAGPAATIFGGRAAVGYAVVALIAFVLGVCVTVLCYRIQLFQREERDGKGKQGDGDGRIC